MQMVMMVFRTSMEGEIVPWVEHERLPYTRLNGAQGKGATSLEPEAEMWGGANSVLLVAVPDDRLNSFRDRVRAFERELEVQHRSREVPFHIFVMPCIQWL